MTLAEVMVPRGLNSSLSWSSVTMSSRFLTYRLTPWNLLMRSTLIWSNFVLSSLSLSVFFCARPTKSSSSSGSPSLGSRTGKALPLSSSTALAASSWLANDTKPKPRDCSLRGSSEGSFSVLSSGAGEEEGGSAALSSSTPSFFSAPSASASSPSGVGLGLGLGLYLGMPRLTVALTISPNSAKTVVSFSSSQWRGMFLMKQFVQEAWSGRSWRRMKLMTWTSRPSMSMPLSLSMAASAASAVS
mmetsp:Transcript_13207/g.26250  ORF Transcript_13207/g.26250 Transcript_13207/m.26250 type:complete len:244 (-) Transcript_13207:537-1268(-)